MITVNEVFSDWMTGGGIMMAINTLNPPWSQSAPVSGLDLDWMFHGNISGHKCISPLVAELVKNSSESFPTLDSAQKQRLAWVINTMYRANWAKEWAQLSYEYDPIENYSMTETMTDDVTVDAYGKESTRTDNLSHSKTGTETDAPNTTETRTDNLSHSKTGTETDEPLTTETRTDALSHTKTGTEADEPLTTETRTDNLAHSLNKGIYGFNSADGSPADTESGTNTGTQTVARTGTDTHRYNTTDADTGTQTLAKTGTDTHRYNTTDADTGTQTLAKTGQDTHTYNTTDANTGTQTVRDGGRDTHTRNYELTRAGNIGVTTSQQMIEQERSLWMWNFFRDVVFPDVESVITCPHYQI